MSRDPKQLEGIQAWRRSSARSWKPAPSLPQPQLCWGSLPQVAIVRASLADSWMDGGRGNHVPRGPCVLNEVHLMAVP